MAKQMTKAEIKGIAALAVVGLPIYGAIQLGESVGWIPLTIIVLSIIGLTVWYKISRKAKHKEALMLKYQDEELVEALIKRSFWQGQTAEQLLDSLGQPHDIDQKVLKSKKREVWKYNHQGGNRYGLRITLDNDQVAGWDQKG
ncbi:hypothetical protein [Kangiella geojedonensis]|uniref:DUF2845 domain-containing protein n=1 Tax=Kangiella geojedonensis TaxID=914150 RepID=A0A0F6RC13_9GAMM|nr:hypothetical protein [Kangiella geojedonensis]AKE51636.1 hypothetical protein TQ33_0659 [Kangiella geojedonensis]